MSLGERLKQGRTDKGLSQTEVAKQLNISRQSISKWENGYNYPDIDNLVLLSKIYDISIDTLLKEKESEYSKKSKAISKDSFVSAELETSVSIENVDSVTQPFPNNFHLEESNDTNEEPFDDSPIVRNLKKSKEHNDEGFLLVIISLISSLVAPIGIIISALILHRNKKTNTYYKIINILCICSILINIYFTYFFISDFFKWDIENNVEPIE